MSTDALWRALIASLVLFCGCDENPFERGADLALTTRPTVVSFAEVTVGDVATIEIEIEHVGLSGTVELSPATLQGGSADLSISGPDKLRLQVGEVAVVTVTYLPSDGIPDSGTVVVEHNVPEQATLALPIQTIPQAPRIRVNPGTVQFGNVSAGSERTLTIQVQNVGSLSNRIDGIGLDLDDGAPFEILEPPETPLQLEPGASVELTLRYTPQVTGVDTAHHGRIRFRTDHEGTHNQVAPVVGQSRHQMLVIAPASANFGWVTVGQSAALDLKLQNIGGEPVAVETLERVAVHPDVKLLGLPQAPFTLQPSETVTITARFAPKSVVAEPTGSLGGLLLTTDDYLQPIKEIPLLGRSAEPSLIFIPEGVADFGVVAIGFQHQRRVQVVNVGLAPIRLDGAAIGDMSADGYELLASPIFPVTLAPQGGTAEFALGFRNPGVSDQPQWGELELLTDDPVDPLAELSLRALTTGKATCRPRYEPPGIDFGIVSPGGKKTMSINLLNDGSLPCAWHSATLQDCKSTDGLCQAVLGGSGDFRLGLGPPAPGTRVFFGDSIQIPLTYEPKAELGDQAGLLVATLADGVGEDAKYLQYHHPTGGVLPTVRGAVGSAGVLVKPGDVTFAVTAVGCGAKPLDATVRRLGELPLSLASVVESECDGQFIVAGLSELPLPLFTGTDGATAFQVQYAPTAEGLFECTIVFEPDIDTAGSGAMTLRGVGASDGQRTDVFQQAAEFQVDILFVVDNSGSMKDEQEALIAGFEGFITQAAVWDVQYHIGVITTDPEDNPGALVGQEPYVDNTNWIFFKQSANVGTHGSGDERGLHTAWQALQPSKLVNYGYGCTGDGQCHPDDKESKCVFGVCGGANNGFMRDDALLTIIWVSDEDEHSEDTPVADYVDFFQSLKQSPDRVKGYALVGPPTGTGDNGLGGCNGGAQGGWMGGPAQGAQPGDRYVEAVDALGGFWFSICDFGKEAVGQPPLLEQIGADAFQPVVDFALSEEPDPASIVVTVGDEPCTEGWTWDASTNTVVFDTSSPCFPGPEVTVVVNYDPVCYPLLAD